MNYYCPRCDCQIEPPIAGECGCLCPACQWFGDYAECGNDPRPITPAECAFIAACTSFRELCHMEQSAHTISGQADDLKSQSMMKRITDRVTQSQHCLLYMFRVATKVRYDD